MTSRDLTENVEQLQIRAGLELTRDRVVAALARLGDRAQEFAGLALTGRSHNVAAQVTTLGKRFANVAEELLRGFERLESLIATIPAQRDQGAGRHATRPAGTARDPRACCRARGSRGSASGL